jgi:uncharacterized protein (TIGR00369 family)
VAKRAQTTKHLSALERLQFELEHPPYHDFLQPRAVSADADNGVVEILLRYRPEFQRVRGEPAFHGGVISGLVDLTAHATAAVKIGRMAPNIDVRIDYMRPAINTDLHAKGMVRRAGRTLAVVDVEIANDEGKLIAIARGILSTVAG